MVGGERRWSEVLLVLAAHLNESQLLEVLGSALAIVEEWRHSAVLASRRRGGRAGPARRGPGGGAAGGQ